MKTKLTLLLICLFFSVPNLYTQYQIQFNIEIQAIGCSKLQPNALIRIFNQGNLNEELGRGYSTNGWTTITLTTDIKCFYIEADYEDIHLGHEEGQAPNQCDGGSHTISTVICLYFTIDDSQKGISNLQPTEFNLTQNYPNPFNPSTQIGYYIATDGFVNLEVYDVLGRRVNTLVNEFEKAGNYSVAFDANDLSSGIYLYRINTDNYIETKRMLLVK